MLICEENLGFGLGLRLGLRLELELGGRVVLRDLRFDLHGCRPCDESPMTTPAEAALLIGLGQAVLWH